MFTRITRSMADGDRDVLRQYREREIGKPRVSGRAAIVLASMAATGGLLWLAIFHWGEPQTPLWPIVALVSAGLGLGFSVDLMKTMRQQHAARRSADAKWGVIDAIGVVDHLVADSSRCVRIDDKGADTIWCLQVEDGQILCVWDWVDEATEHVELDLVPGSTVVPLRIAWTGKRLVPERPMRQFLPGEYRPEQGEILRGDIGQLDAILSSTETIRSAVAKRGPAMAPTAVTGSLANELESLGFYRYLPPALIGGAKSRIGPKAYDWFLAADRAFYADSERLAEGGVKDFLDKLRPALGVEGVQLGNISQSYDPLNEGYVVSIGGDSHTMWAARERKRSWELTLARVAKLINGWLDNARSPVHVYFLDEGEDGVVVLLAPAMRNLMIRSGLFAPDDMPRPIGADS